jgi:CRISPR-associated protein Cmr2
VKADGDSFGKHLKNLSVDELKEFHKKMLIWGFETAEIIKNYGGVPIYIGGDDCLFFAPVTNELARKNILDVCDEINAIFSQNVGTDVTISFGVSISYYKFPLYEALEAAEHLISTAKKEGKNRIALRVLKHSGNYYESVFDKSSKIYTDNFKNLSKSVGNDNVLLSSVVFKLFSQQKIVESIAKDTARFGNYIDNYFNEDIHKGDKSGFLTQIKTLVPAIFNKHETEKATKEVYSMLRLAKFLNGLDDDK